MKFQDKIELSQQLLNKDVRIILNKKLKITVYGIILPLYSKVIAIYDDKIELENECVEYYQKNKLDHELDIVEGIKFIDIKSIMILEDIEITEEK